ncbi:hypothetical protein [uncultured Sphingomonas sp.]|uniref:hypothetical protein n=1 Tax=uncultured Sphingomonas sp. TaxID=158754 RepID=UPI0025FE033C|nr:hypothetical protein [uncultured Sphingomonas sp.]
MLKERRLAVENVKAAFLPVERSAETTAALGARCVATMIEERSKANLPIATGAAAMGLVSEALQLSLAARAKFIEAHQLLGSLPSEIGVHSYGGDECPPNQPFTSAELTLRAVS